MNCLHPRYSDIWKVRQTRDSHIQLWQITIGVWIHLILNGIDFDDSERYRMMMSYFPIPMALLLEIWHDGYEHKIGLSKLLLCRTLLSQTCQILRRAKYLLCDGLRQADIQVLKKLLLNESKCWTRGSSWYLRPWQLLCWRAIDTYVKVRVNMNRSRNPPTLRLRIYLMRLVKCLQLHLPFVKLLWRYFQMSAFQRLVLTLSRYARSI